MSLPPPPIPLAERMRPKQAQTFIGQSHLMAEQAPLQEMLSSGQISSLILWGPPGCGKTTLARLIAKQLEADFYELSAVSAGVKDIRQVIEQAQENLKGLFARPTLLFIDEIHRFNKAQQDALLHSVETGEVLLIGATTENPSFEVNPALLSRCQVYTLQPHTPAELETILQQAIQSDAWLKQFQIQLEEPDLLYQYAGGDARIMLNRFEMALKIAARSGQTQIFLDNALLKRVFQAPTLKYDHNGEEHYNLISALIKSVRGSDPDGAVYWLARMLEGGEDPLFIARRLLILASEDIGNAEPYALSLAQACFQSVHVIGMPEARILLAQVTTYLASCPKSNAAYLAIEAARADVKRFQNLPVPLHLRNAPTGLMKELGYGSHYHYSHDHPDHFVEQQYLPDRLKQKVYYHPTELGKEKTLKRQLEHLWPNRYPEPENA
ncbi:AAA family ATPase [bacterium (Candidatus Blackallbacteria) CG17_big_fil_post_rev_8_21_14_2_50_48_46]|uniref:AAA family ATPase n=1 Tax=bacterium (Candidatus Blackallbacteria) CG17_big_fil_post_rev_8_21_14_2_50_48_46 TaxID=2014261 RepID=A0A2M7G2Z9_9BACT|nr:MAG: AAA family ATPase [bacterium (Candidatus Blackallbacteria) CG18_big_fil_WC_8_21_14_2_50_49_26]PIW16202.1 MAG: AAA family ATPase [bacterium (Candidatus Blackallbacteria) CG17_big_fil_post_rev_8_21_14_2_50_48_46]PIW49915.1 MAG: AAA family ATPase [bacterium (Candidatus Blackallbacteria) CG13_big_fil_rev_8_21_14_2_50_49_14]